MIVVLVLVSKSSARRRSSSSSTAISATFTNSERRDPRQSATRQARHLESR